MNGPAGNPQLARALHRAAVGAAVVGAAFSLTVLAALVVSWVRMDTADVTDSQELAALKARLFERPGDPDLRRRIRQLDLRLRSDYFARRRRLKVGGWMLLAGAAVFLAGARTARDLRRRPPMPGPAESLAQIEHRTTRTGRWLVGAVAAGCIGAAAAAAMLFMPVGLHSAVRYPTFEEIDANWPRFRGPGGSGVSAYDNVPATWDAGTGKGILWKAPIPLPGVNSPVVWGDRVFCTGATKKRAEVFCFHADTGRLLWRRPVKTASTPADPPEVDRDTGYAPSTAVVDGQRVYAIFANGDLACLNFLGAVLWARSPGLPENQYGHAASLTMYENLLIVQLDQGLDAEDGLSEIMGVEGATGKVVWIEGRPVKNSWTTPIVARTPTGDQLITSADPWLIAYDPGTGTEIWRANLMNGDVAPSPVYSGGLVLAAHSEAVLAAIRTDGSGDVTETHVAWQAEDGLPDIVSPLADGKRVYLLDSSGLMTCYRIADGRKLWEKDLDAAFSASPSLVGGRIYLIDERGRTIILAAGDQYQELGRASLDVRTGGEEEQEEDDPEDESDGQGRPETFKASPAFADGRIYIRGSKHLYCISEKGP